MSFKKTEDFWKELFEDMKENNLSQVDAGLKYGVTNAAVSYQIKKRNISYQPKMNRIHSFREDYFEKIDSERKAYWLGFILADGSVSRATKWGQPNRLKFNLQARDKELLEAFKLDIKANSVPIKTYLPNEKTFGRNEMVSFSLNSVKLCSDLAKYSVVKNKVKTCTIPELEDPSLYRHLVRGFFDGDGSIHTLSKKYRLNKKPRAVISFTKNEKILNRLLIILKENIPSTSNKVKVNNAGKRMDGTKKDSFVLSFSSYEFIKSFYYFIYTDSTIYLERKKLKYDSVIFTTE